MRDPGPLRALTVAMAALVGLLAPVASFAQEAAPRLELVYEAVDSCPERAVFEELVTARLGRSPFAEHAARRVTVVLSRAGAHVNGTLVLTDLGGEVLGERSLDVPRRRCGELAESLATALTVLMVTVVVAPPEVEPPVPLPPEAPAGAPAPPSPDVSSPDTSEPDPGEPVRFLLDAGALAGFGVGAEVTLGGRVAAGFRLGWASLALEGGAEAQPATVTLPSMDRIDGSVFTLALVPCAYVEPVGFCLLVGGGALSATVHTTARPMTLTSPLVFVGGRVLLRIELTDALALRPWVEVVATLLRTSVVVDGNVVWEASPIAGRLGLSFSVTLD